MGSKYLEENKWWVSPYNFVDEVTGQFDLPDKVEIHDATLRDGEQTPGVVFRKDDKVRIAEMLDEVGVGNYTRESGIGVDLVMKNPLAMFATAPQFFGREGEVVLGKKSGKASITYTLEKLGIENVSDDAVAAILKEVKHKGAEKRALLTTEEFKKIVDRL